DHWRNVCEYYSASHFISGAIKMASKPNGFNQIPWLLESEPQHRGIGLVGTKFDWSTEPRPKPYIFFEAISLYQFCWFDLMQAYNGGADVTCCPAPSCGKFLAKRSGGRHKAHCSDACRQAARRARLAG